MDDWIESHHSSVDVTVEAKPERLCYIINFPLIREGCVNKNAIN